MTKLESSVVIIFICTSLSTVMAKVIPNTGCEYNCVTSCSDVVPKPAKMRCVLTFVRCICHSEKPLKKELGFLIWFGCILVISMTLCCLYCFGQVMECLRNLLHKPIRTVAPAPGVADRNDSSSSRITTTPNTVNNSSFEDVRGFSETPVNYKSDEFPPEYLAPPAYDMVVSEGDSKEKITAKF